ncbi:MAG: hypothetical protein HC779_01130 [Phyllobacteriaceae bacterium]|nr:hypothetical protein [Phyllobacteriaceae bacterium]
MAGLLAVLLTLPSLVMGIAIGRNAHTGLGQALRLSIALGLVLTFFATVIVAGYLSSSGGHFVGQSTRQLSLMGWSRDGGDLRVAHFLATHALHALPLAGLATLWMQPRYAVAAVIAAATGYAALIAGTFQQALNGLPFLPWLG